MKSLLMVLLLAVTQFAGAEMYQGYPADFEDDNYSYDYREIGRKGADGERGGDAVAYARSVKKLALQYIDAGRKANASPYFYVMGASLRLVPLLRANVR